MVYNPAAYKATAFVSSIIVPPGFSSDPTCNNASIPSGTSLICNITYTPIGVGPAKGAVLTVNYNGVPKSPHSVKLIARGIPSRLTVAQAALDFDDIPLNTTSATKIVRLSNDTGATFNITNISTGNPAFSATQNCVGMLGAADCSIGVTYTASNSTMLSDTLTITDLADGITKQVRLRGTGQ
jgi:hypothetical protein